MADIFKLTKMSYVVVLGLSAYNFASGLLEPTIAPYLEILGSSSEEIGKILSVRWLLVAITSIPFALLSSNIGKERVLQISALFSISSGFALFYLDGTDAVKYFFVLVGLASAAASGPAAAILAENTGEKRVAAFALFSVTWMIPPAIGAGVSAYWFRNTIDYTVVSLSSIFIIVMYTLSILGVLYIILLESFRSGVKEMRIISIKNEFKILFSPIIFTPLILLMFVNFLSGAGAGATLPFLPPYLKSIGASPSELSLLVLTLNIAMGIATQFVTPLVKRFGEMKVYAITTSLSTIFLISLVFSEDLYSAAIFYILRGTFANMNAPIAQAKVLSYIDSKVRATGSAMSTNIRWVGWVIFSPISGRIIDIYGYQLSFVFTAIIYLVSMFLFIWTNLHYKNLEEIVS